MLVLSGDKKYLKESINFEIMAVDEDGYELDEQDLEHFEADHYEIKDRVTGDVFGKYDTEMEAITQLEDLISAYKIGVQCFRFWF